MGAIERSTNVLRVVAIAGCRVVTATKPMHDLPSVVTVALAAAVVSNLAHMTSGLLARLGGDPGARAP